MNEIWLLIFLFTNGHVYASGPHDLETCRQMLEMQPRAAACVRQDRPRVRAVEQREKQG